MLRYRLREYTTADGRKPFNEWIRGLRDIQARARIRARLDRLQLGNWGDHASVGGGVRELRIFYGPGYRVYLSLESGNVILLIIGGTKATQRSDIKLAKSYKADYRKRINANQ
jgi:putative addiction module killer protein